MRILVFRLFGILLVGLSAVFFASNSVGSWSSEEAVKKRIEMFKLSKVNMQKLSKIIRSGESVDSLELVDFHVKWSEEMLLLFPVGSEASTVNGSDASSDIWRDKAGFEKQVRQYRTSSKALQEALESQNFDLMNKKFQSLVKSCKSCHKQFRN